MLGPVLDALTRDPRNPPSHRTEPTLRSRLPFYKNAGPRPSRARWSWRSTPRSSVCARLASSVLLARRTKDLCRGCGTSLHHACRSSVPMAAHGLVAKYETEVPAATRPPPSLVLVHHGNRKHHRPTCTDDWCLLGCHRTYRAQSTSAPRRAQPAGDCFGNAQLVTFLPPLFTQAGGGRATGSKEGTHFTPLPGKGWIKRKRDANRPRKPHRWRSLLSHKHRRQSRLPRKLSKRRENEAQALLPEPPLATPKVDIPPQVLAGVYAVLQHPGLEYLHKVGGLLRASLPPAPPPQPTAGDASGTGWGRAESGGRGGCAGVVGVAAGS